MANAQSACRTQETLLAAARAGEIADYTFGVPSIDDIANGSKWGPERTLEANLIESLLAGADSARAIHPRGVRIKGARIEGTLDLRALKIACPVEFAGCFFEADVDCCDGSLHSLVLTGSAMRQFRGDRLSATYGVFLDRRFSVRAGVSMRGAQIGQALVCDEGLFENAAGAAFDADGLVARGVFFRKSETRGELRLSVARISGSLLMDGAQLQADKVAFNAPGITVEGYTVLAHKFSARGSVRLPGANLGSTLVCEDATFDNPGKVALIADRINVKGGVFLSKKFRADGAVSLVNAQIGGDLDCSEGVFRNPPKRSGTAAAIPDWKSLNGIALVVDGATIEGSALLCEGFAAVGEVRLVVTKIGRNLRCVKGDFRAAGAPLALNATGTHVNGYGILRDGFTAGGEVWLIGANIELDLSCAGGRFVNRGGTAIAADSLTVGGSIFLGEGSFEENQEKPTDPKFEAEGEVRLPAARIGRNLECMGAIFANPDKTALTLQGAEIKGDLRLNKLHGPPRGIVDFRSAKAERLIDDGDSWPAQGVLRLDGFIYGSLAEEAPTWAEDKVQGESVLRGRLSWLNLQSRDGFWPQPYEQLTSVLRAMGHEGDARAVAIAKRKRLRSSGQLAFGGRLWNRLLWITIGYGYRAWLAAVWMVVVVVASGFVFEYARQANLIVPAKDWVYTDKTYQDSHGKALPPEYPAFRPWLYSIDTFLPFVDLDQKPAWELHARSDGDLEYWFCESWFLVHILAGWALAGALVAGLTGLVKKD